MSSPDASVVLNLFWQLDIFPFLSGIRFYSPDSLCSSVCMSLLGRSTSVHLKGTQAFITYSDREGPSQSGQFQELPEAIF